MHTVIQNVRLVQDGVIRPCDIDIREDKIAGIQAPGRDFDGDIRIDGKGLLVSHGFIDIHVHGGGGCDFMDATEDAWRGAAAFHLTHGTTCMVPTTLAATCEEMEQACAVYRKCRNTSGNGARLLGLHLEGPYLSPLQSGAQDPKYIRSPDPEEYRPIVQLCPDILRWTIAPELPGALEMGDYLISHHIHPCIGHSAATYEEVVEATRHGFTHVSHLYSATSTIIRIKGFRHAGIVESAYLLPQLTSEVIADGCHLPAELLQMAYRFIGPNRLALVTDAMRGAGQVSGKSILGSLKKGQRVLVEDGVAKMPDRTAFAGSVCTTDRLVRNMIRLAGAPLPDAVKMATVTPSRILGLQDRIGRVETGREADLVIFDEDIQMAIVMTGGIVRYTNPKIYGGPL